MGAPVGALMGILEGTPVGVLVGALAGEEVGRLVQRPSRNPIWSASALPSCTH